jgi:hypothetical protein
MFQVPLRSPSSKFPVLFERGGYPWELLAMQTSARFLALISHFHWGNSQWYWEASSGAYQGVEMAQYLQ